MRRARCVAAVNRGVYVTLVAGAPLLFLPHSKPAQKCVFVVSKPGARGQLFQLLCVPAAKYHVVRPQRGPQSSGNFGNLLTPLLFAKFFESAQSQIVLVSLIVFVQKMRKLHGLENSV